MIIYIVNFVKYHYEVLESIINKYHIICNINKNTNDVLYLYIIKNDDSFKKYILNKYPNINIIELFNAYNTNIKIKPHIYDGLLKNTNYDYYIDCSVYYYPDRFRNDNKHFYLIHDIIDDNPSKIYNLFYITPLILNKSLIINCDILPFSSMPDKFIKKSEKIPIYIIQGRLFKRNLKLLENILNYKFKYDFKIKIIGKTIIQQDINNIENIYIEELLLHKNIIYKPNLNFIDYHKEFLECYSILPLITKKENPLYYKQKLTSSINYGLSYNLKFIIDNELNNIYKLDNVELFNDENDIVYAFEKSLNNYYS